MGKAALILVLGTGLFLAYGAASRNETSIHTAQAQSSYEERVLAREIARTGFNVTMGILRDHGDDLQAGVQAINGALGYMEGESQGGVYRTQARYRTGHSVEVISTGYFGGAFEGSDYRGGATYNIEDNFLYEVSRTPLHVAQCSRLNMTFLMSEAGYCSAVYMQRRLPGAAQPEAPEMIFAPGNHRSGADVPVEKILLGGTQMNFFIGVKKNCQPYLEHGSWDRNNNWMTYAVDEHVFNASQYDHVHHAFENFGGSIDEMEESIWAMIEQHPENNQRWRIAWEDMHFPQWNRPNSTDVEQSMQALKAFGYDGNGWTRTDQWGYRRLEDHWIRSGGSDNGNHTSYRPDFSDQVVDIVMQPFDGCGQAAGGGEEPGDSPEDDESPIEPPTDDAPSSDPPIFSSPDTPINQIREDQRFGDGNLCPCNRNSNNHKILIWHQEGGGSGQAICINVNGWNGHRNHDRDFWMCDGR